MPRFLSIRSSALLASSWLATAASAQSITTGPASVTHVPVDHPAALALLLATLALAAWRLLRHGHGPHRLSSWLLVAAIAGWAAHGAGLMAQVVSAFTNPAGETRPIAVSPITAGGFTGFQPADFSNNAGQALKITALVLPDYAQCFAVNPANTLQPAGAPTPSPHPACAVGQTITAGASCRVDVETVCRGLIVAVLPTLTAVSPGSGSASGGVGITLTGTDLTGTTAVTFGGVAATSVNVVNATTVTAVTPAHAAGAVDVTVTTAAGSATLANGFAYVATTVGQSSGGGIIAALNGGLQNLIAATADSSIGADWGGPGTAVGAGAQSDTDGAANTVAIQTTLGQGNYAAAICSAYEVDSQGNSPCQPGNACYSDWYLPAKDQLNALYANRMAIVGFANSFYASSTEFSISPSNNAWIQIFASGATVAANKSTLTNVRCVRSFTP